MKKKNLILGFLIGLLILTSCSNNDDNPKSTANLIIGTWKPIKEVDVCSTGSETVSEYSVCEQQSRYKFSAHNNSDLETDGIIIIKEYYESDNDCILGYEVNGTWSLDDNDLTVTFGDETDMPTFFKLTSNTLKIGYYDNDPNDTCDGGNLPSHYYTELVRVE